jgi:hypothetical protein
VVDRLIPKITNPRTHSREQVANIAASIREFGWTNPILAGADDDIVAGHARLLAPRKLDTQEVPVIVPRPWSIVAGRSRKNRSRGAGSVASKAAVFSASSSLAARWRSSESRPVRITLAPSALALRAVSSPIPAQPPIATTVCPRSSRSR